MKAQKTFQLLLPFLILSVPWIYLSLIWKGLPQTIPTHFGINGKPDAFGNKTEVLLAPVIMTVIGLLMYFLVKNIYRIDPKKKYSQGTSAALSRIATGIVVLLSAVAVFILYWTVEGKVEGVSIFFFSVSLFFAYLGNLMHSIKPNYFVGFRIPWTLENEENWRKTHQLASKIWFTGGLLLALLSLLLDIKPLLIVFFVGIFLMVIIPIISSYRLYRSSNQIK